MGRILSLLILLAVVIAPGCHTGPKPDGTVNVTGTVRHFDLEGGFWAIKGDDGNTYDPVGGLHPDFQKEGLRVRVQGKLRPDMAGIHMVGPLIEITKIQAL